MPKINNKNISKKQLSIKEWKYYFSLFENDYQQFLKEYFENRNVIKTKDKINFFRKKYKKYIYNNFNDEVIMSKTGKAPKKNKGSGRPKKQLTPEQRKKLWKELIDSIPNDLVAELLEDWYDNEKNSNKNKQKIKKIIEKSQLSSRKLASIFNVSKSYICNIRNNLIYQKSNKYEILRKTIIDIFYKYHKRLGRKPISVILKRDYNISLSYRQVGRIMNKLSLICIVRRKRKSKEQKNTNFKCDNIVNRDYHNKFHKQRIYATDVTYLPITKDVNSNHLFLSAVIDHKTKSIEGYSISKYNDTQLVLNSMNKNIKNAIIHSDHGFQYSTFEFKKFINENNCIQSMSRIGNSLDNREIEHWFCIFKNELIYHLDFNNLTFEQLKQKIDKYINYYNNFRIQEQLNWLSPSDYKKTLNLESVQI